MKTYNTIQREAVCLGTILGTAALVYGIFVLMSGIHNVDLSVNMGFDRIDTASDMNTYSYKYLYINGMNQIETGAFVMVIGTLCGSINLMALYSMVGRKDL